MIYHDKEGCELRNGLTVVHWVDGSDRKDYVFRAKLNLWVTYDIYLGWRAGNERLFFRCDTYGLEDEYLMRDMIRGIRRGRKL